MILLLSGSMFTYLVFTFYACDLIAGMTSKKVDVPITSFQDVLDNGYHIVTVSSTSYHDYLKASREGSAMHKVYYGMMHNDPDKFYNDTFSALEKILTDKKTLFWGDEQDILGKHDVYKALQLEDAIYVQDAWGLQKNSEYKELFNYWLHKLHVAGIKDIVWQRWTYMRNEEFNIPDADILGYENLSCPFLILVVGMFLAFVSFFCEKMKNGTGTNAHTTALKSFTHCFFPTKWPR